MRCFQKNGLFAIFRSENLSLLCTTIKNGNTKKKSRIVYIQIAGEASVQEETGECEDWQLHIIAV